MAVSAAEIPDKTVLQAIGDRRSIRYYDPERTVEDWKIQTMLQAGRLASCQGNINATEAIVVTKDSTDLWDEIEECVSGFNVQIINQSSHLIFWLTNLNAWYGRANDGLSTLSLSGALTKYHGWNYEFTMTQTVPRLMSFPTERTEMLLRFETGLAVSNAILTGTALDVGSILIAFGRKPGGIEKAFGLPPNYKLTWGHAVGYPLEDLKAGGQRPRLKFEKLFSKDAPGNGWPMVDGLEDALKAKGMIQEQAPTSGRIQEIEDLAAKFSREPGVVSWPEKEVKRLINDDDWDFGPNIKKRAEEVLAQGGLPDYPEEMRETFTKLMEEHGIDASKYLS
ncbi:MAG TPA: nitroreductase family protein [Miltoncostaeaceae bacterium]|nr:nitroreductase family protein [Miltoncostaeaceae bacterium]